MRKSLILTLLLLILAAGSFGYIHAAVDRSKDAVTLDETVLSGDKDMAAGIMVDLNTHCDYRLFWDTRYTVAEKPEISTTFTFSQAQRQQERFKPTFNISLDSMTSGWVTAGRDFESRAESFPLPVQDVAARAQPGEKLTETVYVKDYYDFYPITVDFERPSGFTINEDTNKLFASYFRIPVHPEHLLEINVEKSAVGSVFHIDVSSAQSDVYSHATSLVTDDYCFFTFSCYTREGELLDTSSIPGGYGIYRFPRHTQSGIHILKADELQTVFVLDEEARVVTLKTSQDKSKLLLVTREGEDYMLTVIDAATLVEVQRLRIMRADTESGPWEEPMLRKLYIYADFIALVSGDNRFALLTLDAEGKYEVQFEASFRKIKGHEHAFTHELGMSYDGEKLAVAAFQDSYYSHQSNCSFYLAVYNKAGLAYAGHYRHSLDKSLINDYDLTCLPLDEAPPEVTWSE